MTADYLNPVDEIDPDRQRYRRLWNTPFTCAECGQKNVPGGWDPVHRKSGNRYCPTCSGAD